MGSIVGAGLISHAPVIMFPERMRIEANGGRDFTLATGLNRLRKDVFECSGHDLVLVIDSHWTTTTEFVVTSHGKRAGIFTSSEMPTALHQIPYDIPGDPEIAHTICAEAGREGSWAAAVNDPYLPIQYATLNLWTYLGQPETAWVSISVCQTATTADYLKLGRIIMQAVKKLDRRVMLIASGGLSHIFRPLSQLRSHMNGNPDNIVTAKARAADEQRIAWLTAGHHKSVIQAMPEFLAFEPEARFGHYLMLAGALGGENCRIPGERFSDYESGIGTGQIHLWFNTKEVRSA